MKASNLAVNSAIRLRRSSKLKSTDGNCVSELSEYDMAGAICDCDARNDDVLVENEGGGIVVAILSMREFSPCSSETDESMRVAVKG